MRARDAAMVLVLAATAAADRTLAQTGPADATQAPPVTAVAAAWPLATDSGLLGWVSSPGTSALGQLRIIPQMAELSGGVASQLGSAFPLALAKLHNLSSCRDLFAPFSVEGSAVLVGTRYTGVARASGPCEAGALAYTSVGGGVVTLCDGFAALPLSMAAAVLVHDALHAAGLTEWPVDAEAATSTMTTARVRSACAL